MTSRDWKNDKDKDSEKDMSFSIPSDGATRDMRCESGQSYTPQRDADEMFLLPGDGQDKI